MVARALSQDGRALRYREGKIALGTGEVFPFRSVFFYITVACVISVRRMDDAY